MQTHANAREHERFANAVWEHKRTPNTGSGNSRGEGPKSKKTQRFGQRVVRRARVHMCVKIEKAVSSSILLVIYYIHTIARTYYIYCI